MSNANDCTIVVRLSDEDAMEEPTHDTLTDGSESGKAGIFLSDVEDMNMRVAETKTPSGDSKSSSSSSLETKLVSSAQIIRERTIVHEYMCYKTTEYYARLNRATTIPSIILTGGLILFNSNADSSVSAYADLLKGVNIAGNSLLTILLSVQSAFKFAEKADYFFNQRKKYTRLHGDINNEIIQHISIQRMDVERLKEWNREYNALDENMLYDYPEHVIKNARARFVNHSTPLVCSLTNMIENDIPWRKRPIKEQKRV